MRHLPRLLLLLTLAACVLPARAQTALVRGFVTDEENGEPIQGVNVVLFRGGSLVTGAATNKDGLYILAEIEPGRYALRVTFIGYATVEDSITVMADDVVTRNFTLRFETTDVGEVTVEAEREGAGAAAVLAGFQAVRPQEIEMIPAPDVSGDLVQYLSTLPGVVSVGDQGGQLFIRGGEPTQNLALIDGIPVYQPFHLIGFYSAFPSDIIQVANIYAGGYGARFGGRLSSVIDISTRNGNKHRFEGNLAVAPFVSGMLLEGPIVPGRVSLLASVRTSVIEQGASRIIDQPLPYQFDDQFVKLHGELSEGSTLALVGTRSYDRGTLDETAAHDPESGRGEVSWTNRAGGLRYLLLPTSIPVQAEIILSYAETENQFGSGKAGRSSSSSQFQVEGNLIHYMGRREFRWGLELSTSRLESSLGGQFQNVSTDREFVTEASAYAELGLPVWGGLRIDPGMRISSFPSKGRSFLEPRVRAVLDLGPHRLSAAWGVYHQEIVGLTDRRDAGDVFTAWTSSPLEMVPSARHVIVGWQVQATDWLRVSVEGYSKQLRSLAIAEWTAFPKFTTRLQSADGDVVGTDVRFEFVKGSFYALVNYGYGKVTYRAEQEDIRYWFGTETLSFSPPHDRRHQVNLIASMNIVGLDFSVRWQFGSGLPYSRALGYDEFVLLAGPTDVTADGGSTRVLYGRPFDGRLPTYHRLDVSIERRFPLGRTRALTIQGSLTNAYDRRNLFYIDIYTLRRLDQLPLIPAVGLKLEF